MTEAVHRALVTFHFRIHLKSCSQGLLPEYKNSIFRGILAREFRSNVCHNMNISCRDCSFLDNCQYSSLFEFPKTSPAVLHHSRSVSDPYLISCDSRSVEFAPGDPLAFDFLLFGDDVEKHLPQLFTVIQNISSYPLGRNRLQFELDRVEQKTPESSFAVMDNEVTARPEATSRTFQLPERYDKIFIQFASPFRARENNKLVREFVPAVFFNQVRQRFMQLVDPTNKKTLVFPEFPDMHEVRLHHSSWKDIPCCSSSHGEDMILGGVLASFHMNRSSELDAWLPYLFFCEKYHVGRETTFGFGKYSLWIKQ
ncbi:MAG: CRISPR system precrRNA processing endoribonuclease RAMP protein Cas6 [Alkalicoccus sp.]|nr:MAG: CRISPR system precrRNA processing endoribonuclease RAMP protein Cas6 [Alkalicoccus sp.]